MRVNYSFDQILVCKRSHKQMNQNKQLDLIDIKQDINSKLMRIKSQQQNMSLQNFEILQTLGNGSYASVFKVRRISDKQVYALKQIKMNRLDIKQKNNALNEVRFLASFNSSKIVTYHEAFIEQQMGLLCIVMEFADGGDLMKLIQQKKTNNQKFSENQVWKVFTCLLRGVEYLHNRSILHRDIKPQNIFISHHHYKLGDLNVSKLKKDDKKLTQTGTPYYASPQVWNNQPYDQKTDLWSIGCTIYEMVTLKPPFISKNIESLFLEVTKTKQRPIPKCYSKQLEQVIEKCLIKNAKKRPSIKQMLEHPTVRASWKQEEENCAGKQKGELLKTIHFPQCQAIKNIKFPKANYKQAKEVVSQKLSLKTQEKPDLKPLQIVNERKQSLKQDPSEYLRVLNNEKIFKKQEKQENKRLKKQKTEQQENCNSSCKKRSSPRTEYSCEKLKKISESELIDKKIPPFQLKNENVNLQQILNKKLLKPVRKNIFMGEIVRNQQKICDNLVNKSTVIEGGNQKKVLNIRFDNLMNAVKKYKFDIL